MVFIDGPAAASVTAFGATSSTENVASEIADAISNHSGGNLQCLFCGEAHSGAAIMA
jgi:hypothetical protein